MKRLVLLPVALVAVLCAGPAAAQSADLDRASAELAASLVLKDLREELRAKPADPAVADILARFLAADEQGRLLLVTDLSDALRARGLAAVSDLAGSRAVVPFLSAEAAAPADPATP